MQSEPNELSQETSLDPNTQDSNVSSQHGLDQSGLRLPRRLRAGEERSKPKRSASNTSWSTSSSASSTHGLEGSSRGLRKHSPVDRIAKHERALTDPSKKRNQGPDFAVVQRGRSANDGQVVLADFPNGLLFSSFHGYIC